MSRRSRRSGGRAARVAARAAGLKKSERPVRPGMLGGAYRPLTDSQMQDVFEASLELLEEVGMGDPIPEFTEAVTAAGGWVDDDGRLRFPGSVVNRGRSRRPPSPGCGTASMRVAPSSWPTGRCTSERRAPRFSCSTTSPRPTAPPPPRTSMTSPAWSTPSNTFTSSFGRWSPERWTGPARWTSTPPMPPSRAPPSRSAPRFSRPPTSMRWWRCATWCWGVPASSASAPSSPPTPPSWSRRSVSPRRPRREWWPRSGRGCPSTSCRRARRAPLPRPHSPGPSSRHWPNAWRP